MSPRIEGDFTKISSSYEILPEGTYRFMVDEIEAGKTKTAGLDQLIFKLKVVGGEHDGKPFSDFCVLKTNKGEANTIGLGRVKGYAEAILGQEAANSPEGLDTDQLLKGQFDGIIKHDSYEKKDAAGAVVGQGTSAKLVKLLPAA